MVVEASVAATQAGRSAVETVAEARLTAAAASAEDIDKQWQKQCLADLKGIYTK